MADLDLAAIRARADDYRTNPEVPAEIFYATDIPALLDALAARDAVIAEVRSMRDDMFRELDSADHMVPLEEVIDHVDTILAQSPADALAAVKAEAQAEADKRFPPNHVVDDPEGATGEANSDEYGYEEYANKAFVAGAEWRAGVRS